MRVLLISNFFPPRHSAGTEKYALALATALLGRGHDVLGLSAGDWSQGARYWNGVDDAPYDGVPIRRLNLNWSKATDPNRVLYQSEAVDRWLDDHLARHPPDVVHVLSASTLGAGVLRVVHARQIPLVLSLMDFWFVCPRATLLTADNQLCDGVVSEWTCLRCLLGSSNLFNRVDRWIPGATQQGVWRGIARLPALARMRGARGFAIDVTDRRTTLTEALRLPDVVVSPSAWVRNAFKLAGVDREIRQVAHGQDLSWLPAFRRVPSPGVLRFCYLGQIIPIKGVHLLIDAFARTAPGDRARLDIWGDLDKDPAFVASLREVAARVPGVRLRGPFRGAEVAQVLADADVLVVPSLWSENSPLVIREAFATGTPVVAADVGGMAEAVRDDEDGLLFRRGEAGDLSRQFRRLLDVDGLLDRLRIGIRAVKTIEQEAAEIEAIYAELQTAHRLPAQHGHLSPLPLA